MSFAVASSELGLYLLYDILSIVRFKYMKSLKKCGYVIVIFLIFLTLFCINSKIRLKIVEQNHKLPPQLQNYLLNHGNSKTNKTNISNLKALLIKLNFKQNITNGNKFPSMDNDSPVLIVQVHKDFQKLQYLITSLSRVDNIHNSLLIFSHSYFTDTINRLVQSIHFCKVLQIFYPFSLQLHPHKFPGVDPEDCVSDKQRTPNSMNSFCAHRNATLTEHKQHWWWKANFIFESIRCTRSHTGPIVFLEENNYVAPDLLLMFQYALKSFKYFPFTEVLSFGRPLTKNIDMNLLTVEPWRPSFDIGLAFNKTTWRKIVHLTSHYCMYDESSWSYSLFNLFRNFPKGHVSMVGCVIPRVINTDDFLYSKGNFKSYNDDLTTQNVSPKKIKAVFLFGPDGIVEGVRESPPTGNGGWSDSRDQLLCLDPLMRTTVS